jgi:hypothetical protein
MNIKITSITLILALLISFSSAGLDKVFSKALLKSLDLSIADAISDFLDCNVLIAVLFKLFKLSIKKLLRVLTKSKLVQ